MTKQLCRLISQMADELGRPPGWQSRVAERIGLHGSYVSRVMSGKRSAGSDAVEKVVQALEIRREWFTTDANASYADFLTSGPCHATDELEVMTAMSRLPDAVRRRVLAWARDRWPD